MLQADEALGGSTHVNLSPKHTASSYLMIRVGDVTGVTQKSQTTSARCCRLHNIGVGERRSTETGERKDPPALALAVQSR